MLRSADEVLAITSEQGFPLYLGVANIMRGWCLGVVNQPLALTVAQQQCAKFWELRAATSLARLWRDQGKWIEARDLLAPIYGWFTEGFDTPALQDAKALLDQLA
jgi:predicted ATPase